jgi:hypothetical protein
VRGRKGGDGGEKGGVCLVFISCCVCMPVPPPSLLFGSDQSPLPLCFQCQPLLHSLLTLCLFLAPSRRTIATAALPEFANKSTALLKTLNKKTTKINDTLGALPNSIYKKFFGSSSKWHASLIKIDGVLTNSYVTERGWQHVLAATGA